jgi:RNA polymerase sigma-70 factor (ECF subfamily)
MLSTLKRAKSPPLPSDLEKLFEEQSRFVFGVAYRVTGNRAEAEDILQAVFLRLLQNERAPDLAVNPKGYLYRAAVNMSLDFIRRESRTTGAAEIEQVDAEAPDPDRQYRSAEIQVWFRLALSKLSERAAEIFVLKHLEGYENHEIAEMLGTTRATVAVTLVRSRAFLRKSVERFLGVRKGGHDETHLK